MIASVVEPSPPSNNNNHVRAIVRIRPLNELERSTKSGSRSIIQVSQPNHQHSSSSSSMDDNQVWVPPYNSSSGYHVSVKNPSFDESENNSKTSSLREDSSSLLKQYVFDHVHDPESTQEHVFDSVKYIVDSVIRGYHGTIFAYGQTGTGKTHTLFGEQDRGLNMGITQLSLRHLFATMNELDSSSYLKNDKRHKPQTTFTASFIEIYHDRVYDLLVSSSSIDSKSLSVRESKDQGVYVQDIKEVQVKSSEEAEKLLQTGLAHRHINETRANRKSSRSHAIFTIKVQSTQYLNNLKVMTLAKLTIVDLAGSERQKTTDVQGNVLKEASSINKSLLFLGNLIDNLALKHSRKGNQQDRLISYRDCKLTFLLRDSLGGNSKTCLIATISPSASCIGETISTLNFLQKAKLIENDANINAKTIETVAELQHEVTKLRTQLKQLHALKTDIPMDITSEETAFTPSNKRLQEEVSMLRMQVKKLKALDTEILNDDDDEDESGLLSPRQSTPKASGKTSQTSEKMDITASDSLESVPTLETDETNTVESYKRPIVEIKVPSPNRRSKQEDLLQSMKDIISTLPVVVLSNAGPLVVQQMDSTSVHTPTNKNDSRADSIGLSNSPQKKMNPSAVKTQSIHRQSNQGFTSQLNGTDESRDTENNSYNDSGISLFDRESDDELSQSEGFTQLHRAQYIQGQGLGYHQLTSKINDQESFKDLSHSVEPDFDRQSESFSIYEENRLSFQNSPGIIQRRTISHLPLQGGEDPLGLLRKQLYDLEVSKKNDVDEAMNMVKQLKTELEMQTSIAVDSLDKVKQADAAIEQLQEELTQVRNESLIQQRNVEKEAQEVISSMQDKVQQNKDKQRSMVHMISKLEAEVKVHEKTAQEAYERACSAEEYISRLREEIRSIQESKMKELDIASTNILHLENALSSYAMDRAVALEKVMMSEQEKESLHSRLLEADERLKIQQSADLANAKEAIYELEDIVEDQLTELKRVLYSQEYSSRNRGLFHKLILRLENDLDDFRSDNKQYYPDNSDRDKQKRRSKRWHDEYSPRSPTRGSSSSCGCFDLFYQ